MVQPSHPYLHRLDGGCNNYQPPFPGLGHVRPHDLRHTFVTRLLDLSVLIEQVNYLAGHKTMAMTKRYDHANEERYGGAIEALDEAGKTGSAEALAAARWNQR